MHVKEREDAIQRGHERPRQVRIRYLPDNHQERYAVLDDGRKFVWLVSYAAVVRQGDPASGRDFLKPHVVSAVWREVIGVSFYAESRLAEDRGELQTKVAIRKEGKAQAARSYTTACSTSVGLIP